MHSVRDIAGNFKSHIPDIPAYVVVAVIIATTAFGAFSIGWIARGQVNNSTIQKQSITLPRTSRGSAAQDLIVSSQNSEHFHYRWCSGAKRIKAENKTYYSSYEEAVSEGLEPAGNCPGLEEQAE